MWSRMSLPRPFALFLMLTLGFGASCAKQPAESYADYAEPAPPPAPPAESRGGVQYREESSVDFESLDLAGALADAPAARSTQTATTVSGKGSGGRGRGAPAPVATSKPVAATPQKPDAATQQKPDAATQQIAEDQPKKRMVHYNGWVRLRVTRTEDMVDEVAKLAAGLGGFVESLTPARITVRVPVERFDEAYAAVRKMGELLDESLTAEDVTDAYTAMDLRLQTAQTSRARLIELLAIAKTEEEKIALLQQIQRLTEEIDVMAAKLRTLAALASMSRLTVEGEARRAFTGTNNRADISGFTWISHLSPFRRDVAEQGRLLALPVPEGFVALDLKKRLIAESADGAIFWTSSRDNDPVGDAAYWLEAVRGRLAPEFARAETFELGGWKMLRLVEVGADPYTYLVGLSVDGKTLKLVEVYYPSSAQEKRHDAAVRAVLGGQS